MSVTTVENKLNILHEDARNDFSRMAKAKFKTLLRPMGPTDFKDVYLPISKQQGHTLKQLILDNQCQSVVEFGTSFGISTLYLADGVRQTGGKVVTTELVLSKANVAMKNITEAGLSDYVEIKVGDAMQTLSKHSEPIDLLFLDGWKDLYLPLFQMLSPCFHEGTIIYADNMDMQGTKLFADYVFRNSHTYETRSIDGGKAFLIRMAK